MLLEIIPSYFFYGLCYSGLLVLIFLVTFLYAHLKNIPLSLSVLFQGTLATLLLISSFQALIATQGHSILVLYLPLLAYYGFLYTKTPSPSKQPFFSPNYLGLILIAVLFFSWSFFCLINFSEQGLYIPSSLATQANDFFIYAQRAKFISETGQENYFGILNLLDDRYQGLSPYHYLELWMGSACSNIFQINHVYALGLIVKPLFYFSTALGFLAIMEMKFGQLQLKHFILVISLFFLSGIYSKSSLLGLPEFNLSILSYRFKMISYYPFLIGFVLMMLRGERQKAYIFLAGLMLASIVVIPAFIGGFMLYFLYTKFETGKYVYKDSWILFLSAFAILCFYALHPSPSLQSSMGLEKEELLGSLSFGDLGQIILHFWGNIGTVLLIFLSSIVLFIIGFRQKGLLSKIEKNTFIFCLFILLAGAFSYALLKNFENAIQLFYNPAIACLNIASGLITIIFLANKKMVRWLILILTISFVTQISILSPKLFSHHTNPEYSAAYLQKIQKLAKGATLSSMGGVLKASEDYSSSFSKITYAYTGAYYLLYFEGEISCLSLSDYNIPIDPKNERNNLVNRNSGYFFQYVENQKALGTFDSIEQSQIDFIQKHKINFLVCSKNVTISPQLTLLIKEKIIDSLSGEQFYLLK